jgi:small-conductance mechanosensitive channel
MVLSNAGIDITVLLAGMGIIGIVIGFAAQDSLGNFFAGIMLLLDRPFKIGDYIMFQGDDKVYQVKDVGLRSTKLYDIFEHTMVFLPNSVVANSRIINLERPDAQIKVTINVGVAYGSDVEKVIRVMEDVALQHPDVVKEGHRGPIVRFTGFGDSSLDFILIAWVKDVRDQWEVASELRRTIYRRFAEEGIEIPFPQMDVWIKEMPGEGNVEKG